MGRLLTSSGLMCVSLPPLAPFPSGPSPGLEAWVERRKGGHSETWRERSQEREKVEEFNNYQVKKKKLNSN